MNLAARIESMAARTIGVSPAELPHESRATVAKTLYRRVRAGKLFAAKLGPKTVRYFLRLEMRDAFVIALNTAKAEDDRARATDDGFRPVWNAATPATVPPGVKVKRLPGYTPRFQETPTILPGIVSFGLQRGRVTVDEVDAAINGRRRAVRAQGRRFLQGL